MKSLGRCRVVKKMVASDFSLFNDLEKMFESKGFRIRHRNVYEKNIDGVLVRSIILHAVSDKYGIVFTIHKYAGMKKHRVHLTLHSNSADLIELLEEAGYRVTYEENKVSATGFFDEDNVLEKVNVVLDNIVG